MHHSGRQGTSNARGRRPQQLAAQVPLVQVEVIEGDVGDLQRSATRDGAMNGSGGFGHGRGLGRHRYMDLSLFHGKSHLYIYG